MSSKRKPIDVGALQAVAGNAPSATDKIEPGLKGVAPSRKGRVQIGAFVPPSLRTRLKILAAESDKGVGDIMEEALENYLAKHGK